MTRQEAEELLDLMEERAPRLRAKGFLAVSLGGASFTLAPPELEPEDGDDDQEEAPSDTLHDPWAHGAPGPGSPTVLPKRVRPPL